MTATHGMFTIPNPSVVIVAPPGTDPDNVATLAEPHYQPRDPFAGLQCYVKGCKEPADIWLFKGTMQSRHVADEAELLPQGVIARGSVAAATQVPERTKLPCCSAHYWKDK